MHTPTTRAKDFVAQLQPHTDKRLVFEHDGRRIQPGYHVTEIKAASFRSLDCGARPQQWGETIVQLWDVADKPEHGHMSVRKFLGIWNKVDADVRLDGEAEIKIEWGDALTPAVHYIVGEFRDVGDTVVVALAPVHTTCKPRDEWWMQRQPSLAGSTSCCANPSTPVSENAVVNVLDIPVGAPALPTSAPCCN